tara:strand:+ start:1038 stop:1256 length:219 start_codon:yes stop_codon:yes gene_type:complete
MKKPDARIYKLTLNRNKVTPINAVFIDDKFENVHAATKLSIHGIHFKTTAKSKEILKRLAFVKFVNFLESVA